MIEKALSGATIIKATYTGTSLILELGTGDTLTIESYPEFEIIVTDKQETQYIIL